MPIRVRLVAIVLLVVSLAMVASVYFVTVRARDDADKQATIYATELAGRYGDEVDKTVGNALRTARDVAGTMVALNSSKVTDRGTYDRVLRNLLEAHPDYLGTWAVFAPNALDGNDARYANTSQSDATGSIHPLLEPWFRQDRVRSLHGLRNSPGSATTTSSPNGRARRRSSTRTSIPSMASPS